MSPIVVAIVVMVFVVLGAVGFLVFASSSDDTEEDDEVEETVSITSTNAEACKKFGYYSNTSPASSTTCSALGYTDAKPASESTCKALGYSLASTAAPVTTMTTFCTGASAALNAYIESLATLFNTKKLIRAKAGINNTYYYDETPPATLTAAVIDSTAYNKAGKVKTQKQLFAILRTAEYDKVPAELRGALMGHIATIFGIVGNDDNVSWMKGSDNAYSYDKSSTKLTGDAINKYTFIDSWRTIGDGSGVTYSYLNLVSSIKTSILNELKKTGTSKYAMYCA